MYIYIIYIKNASDLLLSEYYLLPLQGGDCLSLLSTVKRLPEHVAQHFIAQVSIALKHLHEHGVIHRDIKPDNVMVSVKLSHKHPLYCVVMYINNGDLILIFSHSMVFGCVVVINIDHC